MPAQPEPTDRAEVHKLATAVEEALAKAMQTRYLNSDLPTWEEGVRIGTAPPVDQPGIPPMDPRLTQIGRLCLYMGCATVPPGLVASLFLWASGAANPEALKWVAVAIGCAGAVVAGLAALVKNVTRAAPPPAVHHHYEGDVYQDQRQTHSKNIGISAKTNNNP